MSDSGDEYENWSKEGSEKGDDKLKVREMSVLEKEYFKKAVEKHKENLCKP